MSISELFVDNYYDLYCNSLNVRVPPVVSDTQVVDGVITVPANPNGFVTISNMLIRGVSTLTPTVLGGIVLQRTDNIVYCTFPSFEITNVTGTPKDSIIVTIPLPVGFAPVYKNLYGIPVESGGIPKPGSMETDDGTIFIFHATPVGGVTINLTVSFGLFNDTTVMWSTGSDN